MPVSSQGGVVSLSGSGDVPHWSTGQREHLRSCGRRHYPMITIKAEQEHYCLVTDGGSWTVIERRAGQIPPVGELLAARCRSR
jgi:hypothetical protein